MYTYCTRDSSCVGSDLRNRHAAGAQVSTERIQGQVYIDCMPRRSTELRCKEDTAPGFCSLYMYMYVYIPRYLGKGIRHETPFSHVQSRWSQNQELFQSLAHTRSSVAPKHSTIIQSAQHAVNEGRKNPAGVIGRDEGDEEGLVVNKTLSQGVCTNGWPGWTSIVHSNILRKKNCYHGVRCVVLCIYASPKQ